MNFSPDLQKLIKTSPLFIGVDYGLLHEKIEHSSIVGLTAGKVLLSPGDQLDSVYFIVEGRLSLKAKLTDIEPIAMLGQGECFGEMSMIGDKLSTTFVITATACKLVAIDQKSLWSLIESSHEAAINMLKIMADRIRIHEHMTAENLEQRYGYSSPSYVDELTGLYNKSRAHKVFERLLYRSTRNDQGCGLIVLEIDDFKKYAEDHGELGADQVLRAFAQTILTCMRPHDHAGYIDSGQFTVILPHLANLTDGMSACQRLKNALALTSIVLPSVDELPSTTASIGISISQAGDTLLSLENRAEAALQQAKLAGGNCAVSQL